MSKAVLCIATTQHQARSITDSLKAAGFNHDDISVLLADETATGDFAHENDTRAPEGAATGAGAGGLLGGALGWMVGIGTLAIPGAGPFLAAGPILTALGGLTVGAAAGGVAGALVGVGIADEDAKRYESSLSHGNVLMSVHTDDNDEVARVKAIFEREGAKAISCSGESPVETSASRTRSAGEDASRLPLGSTGTPTPIRSGRTGHCTVFPGRRRAPTRLAVVSSGPTMKESAGAAMLAE